MEKTRVIFEYDETVKRWEVKVSGVSDEKEAMQAVNSVLLTIIESSPVIGLEHKVRRDKNDPGKFIISIATFPPPPKIIPLTKKQGEMLLSEIFGSEDDQFSQN